MMMKRRGGRILRRASAAAAAHPARRRPARQRASQLRKWLTLLLFFSLRFVWLSARSRLLAPLCCASEKLLAYASYTTMAIQTDRHTARRPDSASQRASETRQKIGRSLGLRSLSSPPPKSVLGVRSGAGANSRQLHIRKPERPPQPNELRPSGIAIGATLVVVVAASMPEPHHNRALARPCQSATSVHC